MKPKDTLPVLLDTKISERLFSEIEQREQEATEKFQESIKGLLDDLG